MGYETERCIKTQHCVTEASNFIKKANSKDRKTLFITQLIMDHNGVSIIDECMSHHEVEKTWI